MHMKLQEPVKSEHSACVDGKVVFHGCDCHAANPITAFGGQGVLSLQQLIQQNQSRFHRPPIQPVGSLLTLVDEADAGTSHAILRWLCMLPGSAACPQM